MNHRSCLSAVTLSVAAALTLALSAGRADAQDQTPSCAVPGDITRLDYPLTRTARKLTAHEPVTIVAIGSSSTAGAGASSPDKSYPSRLAAELAGHFPQAQIKVINSGINGEEAREMLVRLNRDVIDHKPDLVIWQVGTNAILRNQPLTPAGALINEGLERMKDAGVDVVLMDPQFAPKVLAKSELPDMLSLLHLSAKLHNVGVFRRFAAMKHWNQDAKIGFDVFVSPDELHMNDWSYGCVAKLMGDAIAEAATRSTLTASSGGGVR